MSSLARLENISKQYKLSPNTTPQKVLSGVSLEVLANQSIAITGPSGSGKSTLLNILGTLDIPDSGMVYMDNKPVNHLSDNELSIVRNRYIGFVFQSHHLLPQLTLFENVMLPLIARNDKNYLNNARDRALQLIDYVGLTNCVEKFPFQLSVGECQRTAVVRALIGEPKLLLADEPTGALDAANAEALTQVLLNCHTQLGVSLVVVTHSTELASAMTIHYRLREGELIKQ